MPTQPIHDFACGLGWPFPLREMPGSIDQPPLVWPGEVRIPAFARLRRVHRVEHTVQRQRGHALLRQIPPVRDS